MGTQVSARSNGLNEALVVGQLVAEPASRDLPSGSVAVSFSLTVRSPGLKTTSVPVVWFDPPRRVMRWAIGEQVVVCGPVVRRFYQAGGGLASATEVVVTEGQLARHAAKVERLVQARCEQIRTHLADMGAPS